MAEGIISFPFRITAQGAVAVIGYGTDQEAEEAIAVLSLTQEGERLLTPGFGIPDPAFYGLHAGDLQTGLDEYGPEGITIDAIETEELNDTQQVATVRWSRDDDENEEES